MHLPLLSVCPPVSLSLSVLCGLIYLLCRPASGLRCFSFSVSVFLQLSEFLSLCKSLCPFLSFANAISHVYAYAVCACVSVCVCARTWVYMLSSCAWACLCSLRWSVCFYHPDTLCTCARTVGLNHCCPSVWGVKYLSAMKYISVWRSHSTLITDIGKKLPTVRCKTSSISQLWLIPIVINYFSLNSWCTWRMPTYF